MEKGNAIIPRIHDSLRQALTAPPDRERRTTSAAPDPPPSFGAARARDIDNAGRIVGSVWDDATASERAALWRQQ
jgi:hypothetical protein